MYRWFPAQYLDCLSDYSQFAKYQRVARPPPQCTGQLCRRKLTFDEPSHKPGRSLLITLNCVLCPVPKAAHSWLYLWRSLKDRRELCLELEWWDSCTDSGRIAASLRPDSWWKVSMSCIDTQLFNLTTEASIYMCLINVQLHDRCAETQTCDDIEASAFPDLPEAYWTIWMNWWVDSDPSNRGLWRADTDSSCVRV